MLRSGCVGFLASASLISLWLGWTAIPASAERQPPLIGYGLFCGTGQEIEAAIGVRSRDIVEILTRVNDRFGHESCNVLTATFFRGDETRTVLIPEGVVHILKVRMVGFQNGDAWRQLAAPTDRYVAIFEKAERV
jgi:hypothetical protein